MQDGICQTDGRILRFSGASDPDAADPGGVYGHDDRADAIIAPRTGIYSLHFRWPR